MRIYVPRVIFRVARITMFVRPVWPRGGAWASSDGAAFAAPPCAQFAYPARLSPCFRGVPSTVTHVSRSPTARAANMYWLPSAGSAYTCASVISGPRYSAIFLLYHTLTTPSLDKTSGYLDLTNGA